MSGEASRRWLPRLATVAFFVALTAALAAVRSENEGLWDWDTYGRLHFIHHYEPNLWLDGHVAYHFALRALMAPGLDALSGIFVLTAAGAAGLVAALAWICRREGLTSGATALVLLAATLGSPGLVSLFLLAEDNLAYLPLVLALFYLRSLPQGDARTELRRATWSGLLLAAAMAINVSLLVLLFAVAAAPLLWKSQRARAWALVVSAGVALLAYELAHAFPFTGAKVALHEFLPQALQLRDFNQSTTPLLSLARVDQYLGGLRAIAMTPSVHLMRMPAEWQTVLVVSLPRLLAGIYLVVAWKLRGLLAAARQHLDLVALFGVALVFPYFYEPALIERWDTLWVGLLVGLVLILKTRPPPLVMGLLACAIAIQSAGSLVAIAHHGGRLFVDPALVQMRAAAREVRKQHSDPVVLPFFIDRLLLADLTLRDPASTVYLVRDDGETLACFRMVDLMERPVPLSELQDRLRSGGDVFVHPLLSRHSRRLLGLPSE